MPTSGSQGLHLPPTWPSKGFLGSKRQRVLGRQKPWKLWLKGKVWRGRQWERVGGLEGGFRGRSVREAGQWEPKGEG